MSDWRVNRGAALLQKARCALGESQAQAVCAAPPLFAAAAPGSAAQESGGFQASGYSGLDLGVTMKPYLTNAPQYSAWMQLNAKPGPSRPLNTEAQARRRGPACTSGG